MKQANTPRTELLKIVKEKHDLTEKIMRELDIEAWLIFVRETSANPDPVQNLVVGGDLVWESAIIFINNGQYRKICIVGNFDADAEVDKAIWDEVIPYTQGISTVLNDTLRKYNPKNIALNYSTNDVTADGLSHGMYMKLNEYIPDYSDRFISAERLISRIRSRKTETELKLITEACILADRINDAVQQRFRAGMTEIEIQELYYQEMERYEVAEAWQRNSCPAVDVQPGKSIGHVGPSELKIEAGKSLHNDFGVKLHGYCSDLQRMWYFGKREDMPEELIHAFNTVHGAITAAAEFIKPGVKGFEVDKIARDYVISKGYEEYQHALGHQVGMLAHDGGETLLAPHWERYGALPDGIVEEGNVFTLELYVKTEKYGMVSLEEDIVVTKDACRFLVPRLDDWICIEL